MKNTRFLMKTITGQKNGEMQLPSQPSQLCVDPGLSHNVDADYRQLQLARQGFEEDICSAGQKPVCWSRIRECQQKPEEHPSDFLLDYLNKLQYLEEELNQKQKLINF